MSANQEFASKKLELKDIKNFKLLIMVFIVLKVIAVALYIFLPLISAIFYDVGTFLLLLGMRVLSKNQDDLNSATKTSLLFILAMGFLLVSALMLTLYPYSVSITSSKVTTLSNLANLELGFGSHAFVIAALILFGGIITAVASFFFDGWFNEAMQQEKPFKMYTIYGGFFAVGEVILFAGFVVLQRAILEVINGIAGYNTEGISFTYLIIYFGLALILISFIIEIYAGYQLLKRVSNASLV